MAKRRSVLENEIQREIEASLGAEPDLLLLRNSVGGARFFNETDGKEFFVPYGLGKGSPDIVGILRITHRRPVKNLAGRTVGFTDSDLPDLGVWFCLEVKPPEGELEDDQKKCHEIWRRFGAFVKTVRSVADAREALEQARRIWS